MTREDAAKYLVCGVNPCCDICVTKRCCKCIGEPAVMEAIEVAVEALEEPDQTETILCLQMELQAMRDLANSYKVALDSVEHYAQWIEDGYIDESDVCSYCGMVSKQGRTEYCSYCGAKMDGNVE